MTLVRFATFLLLRLFLLPIVVLLYLAAPFCERAGIWLVTLVIALEIGYASDECAEEGEEDAR